jgi:phosphoenolpyruvate-protein kinase (PTS system EI component)
MGQAWVVGDVLTWSGPPTQIGQDDVDGELLRLANSVEETLAELDQYAKRGEQNPGPKAIPEHSILVVERLLPSDVVLLPKSNVVAVVVQALGQGSPAAILAREKGTPTITEIPGILALVSSGTELLVDGFRGTLVIAPTIATRTDFQARMEKWRATLVRCKGACRDPARTLDGQLVSVEANIGIHDDAELALDNGADGVGLLRIEQLYFARPMPPTEDELFRELESLIAPLGNRPVTIRLLDVGGDKPLPYLALPPTSNPGLGRLGQRLLSGWPRVGHATIEHRRNRSRRSARNALRGVGRARSIRATLAENGISRAKRCSHRHSRNEGFNPHSQY